MNAVNYTDAPSDVGAMIFSPMCVRKCVIMSAMKHWLYVSVVRGRMTEYYLLPCSKRSDVLTTVDSFCGSIVDANVIYSDEIAEWFESSPSINMELPLSEMLTDEPIANCRTYAQNDQRLLDGKKYEYYFGRNVYEYLPDDGSGKVRIAIPSIIRARSLAEAGVAFTDCGKMLSEMNYFSGDIGEGGSTVFAGVAFLKKISATFPACECFCEEPNVSNAVLSDNDRHLLLAAILRVDSNRARDGQTCLETAS